MSAGTINKYKTTNKTLCLKFILRIKVRIAINTHNGILIKANHGFCVIKTDINVYKAGINIVVIVYLRTIFIDVYFLFDCIFCYFKPIIII